MQITCPDCKIEIQIHKNIKTGHIIDCHNCGAEIKITNVEPLKYELIEDEK